MAEKKVKKALALSGGGPVAGIEIGALKAFEEAGIEFDVFSCDCIGSWVAAMYNGAPKEYENKRVEWVEACFEQFFVPDDIYESYPIMRGFAIDFFEYARLISAKLADPATYQTLFLPNRILEYFQYAASMLPYTDTDTISDVIGRGLSVNPFTRLAMQTTMLLPKSGICVSPKSEAYLKKTTCKMVDFDRLFESDKLVYHNAYNLNRNEITSFVNREDNRKYGSKKICPKSLAAASGILYYLENAEIDGDKYCEGANIDTVNFYGLVTNHRELEDIYVVKITDYQSVKPPKTVFEAACLEVMLPFDTIADDDVELFKYKYLKDYPNVSLHEVPMQYDELTYDWSYKNLKKGIEIGYRDTKAYLEKQKNHTKSSNISGKAKA